MALSNLTDRDAVLKAIDEFNVLGQETFLSKYGFGKARQYWLFWDGKKYDSKTIAGVAHGYQFPDRGALSGADFSGGETVKAKLEDLDFKVPVACDLKLQNESRRYFSSLLQAGEVYSRKQLQQPTLRMTPAMEAGIADHIWTLQELIA